MTKTGQVIPINSEMVTMPVLRRLHEHNMTANSVLTIDVQSEIRRLSLRCRFEHMLVAYCFRRGVAHVLAYQTTREDRKFVMGHAPNSTIYTVYRSKVSTIDLVALFRNLDERLLEVQLWISLNHSNAAPLTVSNAVKVAIPEDEPARGVPREVKACCAAILKKSMAILRIAKKQVTAFGTTSEEAKSVYRSNLKLITNQVLRRHSFGAQRSAP
jgi:hypothetical protein